MGKNDAGGTKAIAKGIKAKGLQKLRWYCQMCEKQCRDENGFKCHCASEGHQRQMELFKERPKQFIDDYSKQFLVGFMGCLRVKGQARVRANQVYNEYIKDRTHIHMNSTQWDTLTGFIQWLDKQGKAIVEETPKGWYLTYIDDDPLKKLRREEEESKEQKQISEEEKERRKIEKRLKQIQIEEEEIKIKHVQPLEQKLNETSTPITSQTNENGKLTFKLGGGVGNGKISFGLGGTTTNSNNKPMIIEQKQELVIRQNDIRKRKREEEEELPIVDEEEELPRVEEGHFVQRKQHSSSSNSHKYDHRDSSSRRANKENVRMELNQN